MTSIAKVPRIGLQIPELSRVSTRTTDYLKFFILADETRGNRDGRLSKSEIRREVTRSDKLIGKYLPYARRSAQVRSLIKQLETMSSVGNRMTASFNEFSGGRSSFPKSSLYEVAARDGNPATITLWDLRPQIL